MASRVETSTEVRLAKAWPRFWARLLDIQLYSFPVGFLLIAIFPSMLTSEPFSGPSGDYLLGFISLPLVMLLDAIVLSKTGTSPGKALAALTLVTKEGDLVSVPTAISRNIRVYLQGLVLGIPLLVLFGYIGGYNAVKERGVTDWDEQTDSRIVSRDETGARTWLVGVFAVIAMVVGNALARAGGSTY